MLIRRKLDPLLPCVRFPKDLIEHRDDQAPAVVQECAEHIVIGRADDTPAPAIHIFFIPHIHYSHLPSAIGSMTFS